MARSQAIKKGGAEAPPFRLWLDAGLVRLDLTLDTRPVQTGQVKDDSEVTLGQFLRTQIADEGECVTELELRLSDDIPLESRRCRDSVGTTAGEREHQLGACRHHSRCLGRRRGATTRGRAVVIENHRSGLRRSAERILRGISDRY